MAYADRNQSGSRVVAIVVVSVLVFAMGYAFVTGLTYNYVKKMQDQGIILEDTKSGVRWKRK